MYELEDIREFMTRRTWLVGRRKLLTEAEYVDLKARALFLPTERSAYLRAFIDGWLAARA